MTRIIIIEIPTSFRIFQKLHRMSFLITVQEHNEIMKGVIGENCPQILENQYSNIFYLKISTSTYFCTCGPLNINKSTKWFYCSWLNNRAARGDNMSLQTFRNNWYSVLFLQPMLWAWYSRLLFWCWWRRGNLLSSI